MANRSRADIRSAVHTRIRKKLAGTAERPRLAVYRSLNHISAQIIDDAKGHTLCSVSTVESDLRGKSGGNVAKVDIWGRRRLAYEINKQVEGIYAVIDIDAEPAAVAELDRQLNLNESVLRTKLMRPEVH